MINISQPAKFDAFASTAGGLRTCYVAAFASLKKYAAHFFNPAFGGTESKEAPTQVLVEIRDAGYSKYQFFWEIETILKI